MAQHLCDAPVATRGEVAVFDADAGHGVAPGGEVVCTEGVSMISIHEVGDRRGERVKGGKGGKGEKEGGRTKSPKDSAPCSAVRAAFARRRSRNTTFARRTCGLCISRLPRLRWRPGEEGDLASGAGGMRGSWRLHRDWRGWGLGARWGRARGEGVAWMQL